jgi:hypothetical protein
MAANVQIFEAAVLAGHKKKTCPDSDDYYSQVLSLVDELSAKSDTSLELKHSM